MKQRIALKQHSSAGPSPATEKNYDMNGPLVAANGHSTLNGDIQANRRRSIGSADGHANGHHKMGRNHASVTDGACAPVFSKIVSETSTVNFAANELKENAEVYIHTVY